MNLIGCINAIPFGQSAEKGFWLYQHLPAGALRTLEADQFRGVVRYAYQHSKFYRRKFDEFKIDVQKVRGPEDLGDFFTTAEDLRAFNEEFLCQTPDTAYESTGTTSKKTKRVYFSRQEVREAGWAGAVGLWGVGVRPKDRIASSFDYSFWVSGPVLASSCEVLGAFHVEAGRISPQEFYERLSDYRVTVIVGDPSWIYSLSEIAEKKGAWPLNLLIAGGENMTEESRRYIESVWKTDMLLSYGQTEAFGAIGMETRAKEGYQLNEFHNFFEIIQPDSEGYGELVYTTLNRRVMPLIRYKSGDLTKFLKGPGRSGLPGRRIAKLRGRVDEWIPTAMGNVAPWMFEPVFSGIADITEDWQVVLKKKDNKDLLEFRVEATGTFADTTALKQAVLHRLKTELPDAWKLHEQGLFFQDVLVCPRASLRNNRKLRRILDERKF